MGWRVGEDIARYPGAFISRFIRATASTIQLDVASVPCRHCPPDCLVKSNTLCSDQTVLGARNKSNNPGGETERNHFRRIKRRRLLTEMVSDYRLFPFFINILIASTNDPSLSILKKKKDIRYSSSTRVNTAREHFKRFVDDRNFVKVYYAQSRLCFHPFFIEILFLSHYTRTFSTLDNGIGWREKKVAV